MASRKEHYEKDLISVVAHDLRSPISAMRGFLDLVENLGELNDQQGRYIERAFMALNRMEGLISTMLKFAEVGTLQDLNITDVDLRLLVDDTVLMLTDIAAARQITLHVTSTAGKSTVPADADLIAQVIQNLLGNAIKYNKDGGEVSVKITRQGPVMRVDVRDTGIGISEEDLPNIFDEFFRVSRGRNEDASVRGSGLGLAIVKVIIDMHDGDIWVDSTLGEGSTFSFTLPMHRDDDSTATEPRRRFGLFPSEQASEASDAVDDSSQESHDRTSDSESREDSPDTY